MPLTLSILDDSKKLYRDYHVNISNCVDLSLLARSVDNARWKGKYTAPIGLARLCDVYQDLSLSKGSIRTSNWELPLSYAQQNCRSPRREISYHQDFTDAVFTRCCQRLPRWTGIVQPTHCYVSEHGGATQCKLLHFRLRQWQSVRAPRAPFATLESIQPKL